MTAHRKRLKKLMQSVGIQRNNFEDQLKSIREFDKWTYQDTIDWVRFKQEKAECLKHDTTFVYAADLYPTGNVIDASLALKEVGISTLDASRSFKSFCDVLAELSDKWNETM